MEIFCSGTAVVTVPLSQDCTKAEIMAWQDMWLILNELCLRKAGESQRLFSGAGWGLFCSRLSQAGMMEMEQFTQKRRSDIRSFPPQYNHLLILPVPEVIYEREIKHKGKTVENIVKQIL